jgi:tRNA threonylcarbamoyladenosine biosynthesis protein TsaE
MEKTFLAPTESDLLPAAEYLKKLLHPGTVVCFHGEMGAGKTTFIKILLREMGVKGEVDSPTFAIVNEYALPNGNPVFHFDFYRLKTPREAIDIGLEDYLDAGEICLMEWPDLVLDFLPEDRIAVHIQDAIKHREIRIVSNQQ